MNLRAPRTEQLAWAAGLFEGEGSISWHGDSFALQLKNTDESVVNAFADILELGWIYGPYDWQGRDGYKRKPFWVWLARNDIAIAALDLLAPWLSERRLGKAHELTGLRFHVKTDAPG